jgi:hypothetical protein
VKQLDFPPIFCKGLAWNMCHQPLGSGKLLLFIFLGCAVTTEILVICSLKKSYVLADWSSENEALSDTLHPGKKLLLLSLIFKFKKHIT